MLIQADVVSIPLPDKTFHCAVFSPPYWGLRKYAGEQQRVWGGDPDCEHEWEYGDLIRRSNDGGKSAKQLTNVGANRRDEPIPYAFCQLCGAWYGELGLEPTPELHIEHMVEIFREIRRVLRDDGVVWLNYGDCYSAAGWECNRQSIIGSGSMNPEDRKSGKSPGLAAGNLMMMPHKVAQALQEPYYIGRIKDEKDRVWMATIIEAEGCIYILRRPKGQKVYGSKYIRKQDTYTPGLEVANTNPEIAKRCAAITGYVGGTSRQTPKQNPRRDQTIYRWTIRGHQCRNILREVYPYMITKSKRTQNRIALGAPSSGEKAKKSWDSLKKLHHGHVPTIDFPAPRNADLWEPGWIVRNDVVWKKPNPMPESVAGWRWEQGNCDCRKPAKLADIGSYKGSAYLDGIRQKDADPTTNTGFAQPTPVQDCPKCHGTGKVGDPVLRKGSWRHTRAHEFIFQLVKKMNYYSNQEAVREGFQTDPSENYPARAMILGRGNQPGKGAHPSGPQRDASGGYPPSGSGRNPRSVLDVPTQPYKGSHYATFPVNLIAPLIRASCPKRCCPECGAPWAPVVEVSYVKSPTHGGQIGKDGTPHGMTGMPRVQRESNVIDHRPTCSCEREDHIPGIVLDPFIGSGTTGAVARELGRRWVGLDISMEYLDQQAKVRALKWTPSNALDDLPLFRSGGENENENTR